MTNESTLTEVSLKSDAVRIISIIVLNKLLLNARAWIRGMIEIMKIYFDLEIGQQLLVKMWNSDKKYSVLCS